MILNEKISVVYEHICLEKHHIEVVYNPWFYEYRGWPLFYNNTNELIFNLAVEPIWGLEGFYICSNENLAWLFQSEVCLLNGTTKLQFSLEQM